MKLRYFVIASTISLVACGSSTDAESNKPSPDAGTGGATSGGTGGSGATGGSSGTAGSGGSTGGAAGVPSTGGAPSCSDLKGTESMSSIAARVEKLQTGLWQKGWNVNSVTGVESDHVLMLPINAPLSSSKTPELAALDFVSQLPDSPFVASEYEVWETKSLFDSKTVIFKRHVVGGLKTRFGRPGLVVSIEKGGDGTWQLKSFQLYPSVAYATAAEVEQLIACTTETPPDTAKIYEHEFEGLLFEDCGPLGTYTYLPKANDKLEWRDTPIWEGTPDGVMKWNIVRPAHFIIDPTNYWSQIGYSDCLCHEVAGYSLIADYVAGTVISYTPGINCVVC